MRFLYAKGVWQQPVCCWNMFLRHCHSSPGFCLFLRVIPDERVVDGEIRSLLSDSLFIPNSQCIITINGKRNVNWYFLLTHYKDRNNWFKTIFLLVKTLMAWDFCTVLNKTNKRWTVLTPFECCDYKCHLFQVPKERRWKLHLLVCTCISLRY